MKLRIGMVVGLVVTMGQAAWADTTPPAAMAKPDAPAAAKPDAAAKAVKPKKVKPAKAEAAPVEPEGTDVKAAKSIAKHDPVDPGTEFAVGDSVFVWSKVAGQSGKKVTHVWTRDGKQVFSKELDIKGEGYRTYSRMKSVTAGAYTVDVNGDDGAKLGTIAFTVK